MSMRLTILFWAEIILSARILLFTVPVLIQKGQNNVIPGAGGGERLMIFLTFVALLYFMTGLLSVLKNRRWRFFHFLVAGWIALVTVWMIKDLSLVAQQGGGVFIYYLPVMVSAAIVMMVLCSKEKSPQAKASA